MKLNGRKIEGPNVETVIIPRADGNNLVFKLGAVLDYEPFRKKVKVPEPPKGRKPGGTWVADEDDPEYKAALVAFNDKEFNWMWIQSLLYTPGLEFEVVKADDPETWPLLEQELKDAGLTVAEIARLVEACLTVNGLNEAKIKEAREAFAQGQAAEGVH